MHCHSLSKVSLLLLSMGTSWGLLGSVCSGNDIIAKGVTVATQLHFREGKKPSN